MNAPALTVEQKLPSTITAKLSSSSVWYVKRSSIQSLEIILEVQNENTLAPVNAELVKIYMNSQLVDFLGVQDAEGRLHFTKPITDIAPNIYTVQAEIHNGDNTIKTNTIEIKVSEPLYVSWTFDWEGWDVPNESMDMINNLSLIYPTLKFTHFVSPRIFLPSILTDTRKNEIISFLKERTAKGDEIAMHLHMHYDLVSASGVSPKSTHPWGFRTEEGYDIPTTEYTPDEFRKIVQYAQGLASENGFPHMKGYRAGGWYLSTPLLNELKSLGYEYDSSGRDKPYSGAFRNIPWNLPVGAQPYFPSTEDENIPSIDKVNVLEIPSNGLSTFDQSIEMMRARIKHVYNGEILVSPKTLVFVSHPQFYSREFYKIPQILKEINSLLQVADAGPALFVTTGEISEIWYSLNK